MFTCHLCDKQFTKKYNLQRHLTRQTDCQVKSNQCKCCNKIFYDSSNRKKHEVKCLSDQKYKLLEAKVHELELMLKSGVNPLPINNNNPLSIEKHNNSHNTTMTNNNTTNITNNFVINKFGCEDISHITKKDMITVFRKCFSSVPHFIKLKHFNKETPQNCNMYIADIKSRYAFIYNNDKWEITDKNALLQDLYSENCNYLECEFNKMEELDEITINKFETFLNKKDEDATSNMVKENIRQLLYNEKGIPTQLLEKVDANYNL
jgi:hypothetical protein